MKVAIFHELVYPYSKGGGEVQRFQIARHLKTFGHEVSLIGNIMPDTKRREVVDGVEIERVGVPLTDAEENLPRIIGSFCMFLKSLTKKYDVMMANPYFPLSPNIIAAKIKRKPVTVTWDDIFGYSTFRNHKGVLLGILGHFIEKTDLFFSRFADTIFTVSNATAKKLEKSGINHKKIVNIRSGINIEDYSIMKTKRKKQIIYIGRHVFYKNIQDLIFAFKNLLEEFPDYKLVIAGSGPMTDDYKKIVIDMKLEKNVSFSGFVNHEKKKKMISESQFLVLPSSFEGFGLTPIEANACCRPYIAYDIAAIREVSDITRGGVLVEERNVEALTDAMRMLIKNPVKADTIGKTGRKNVEKFLTWENTSRIVEKELKKIVK